MNLKPFVERNELLYRAVKRSKPNWLDYGKPTSAMFRDSKGISVDRDGERSSDVIIDAMKNSFQNRLKGIAVLVAIAIPVFTTQLEKSRAATDLANIRSGYAAATTTMLADGTSSAGKTYYLKPDGTVVAADSAPTDAYKCKGAATNADSSASIGSQTATSLEWVKDSKIKYTVNADATSITIAKE